MGGGGEEKRKRKKRKKRKKKKSGERWRNACVWESWGTRAWGSIKTQVVMMALFNLLTLILFPFPHRSLVYVEGDCSMNKFQGKDGTPTSALSIVQSESFC